MLYTLASTVTLGGIGLHSGQETQVSLHPETQGRGRYFVRLDLPGQPTIAVAPAQVRGSQLATELVAGGAKVRTTEHLLSALVGLGVAQVRIEITGEEVPILDGSALPWVEAIAAGGLQPLSYEDRPTPSLTEAIWVRDGEMFVAALPAPSRRFTYGIDFDYAPIGQQWYSWQPDREPFAQAIAPARTFGFADQVAMLRDHGLILGGSLENALVCDRQQWLNPPLRFPDEPVRHKILDLLGDLAMLDPLPIAHYLAYKASHRLHSQLVQQLDDRLGRMAA